MVTISGKQKFSLPVQCFYLSAFPLIEWRMRANKTRRQTASTAVPISVQKVAAAPKQVNSSDTELSTRVVGDCAGWCVVSIRLSA